MNRGFKIKIPPYEGESNAKLVLREAL